MGGKFGGFSIRMLLMTDDGSEVRGRKVLSYCQRLWPERECHSVKFVAFAILYGNLVEI